MKHNIFLILAAALSLGLSSTALAHHVSSGTTPLNSPNEPTKARSYYVCYNHAHDTQPRLHCTFKSHRGDHGYAGHYCPKGSYKYMTFNNRNSADRWVNTHCGHKAVHALRWL